MIDLCEPHRKSLIFVVARGVTTRGLVPCVTPRETCGVEESEQVLLASYKNSSTTSLVTDCAGEPVQEQRILIGTKEAWLLSGGVAVVSDGAITSVLRSPEILFGSIQSELLVREQVFFIETGPEYLQ